MANAQSIIPNVPLSYYKRLSKETFNRQAAEFDSSNHVGHVRKLYPKLRPILAELSFESVLDIGCGTGELLAELGQVRRAGLDISPNMIAVARQKLGPEPDLRVGDAEYLPWRPGSFDAVFCTNSFHHFPDPDRVLVQVRRVLRPGGHLVLADISLPGVFRWIINLLLPVMRTGDVRFYSKNEVQELLVRNDFQVRHWQASISDSFITIAQSIN